MALASYNTSCWPYYGKSELAHALGPVWPERPARDARPVRPRAEAAQDITATTTTWANPTQSSPSSQNVAEQAHAQAPLDEGPSKGMPVVPFAFTSPRSATAHELRYLRDSRKQNVVFGDKRDVPVTDDDDDDIESVAGTISESPMSLTWTLSEEDTYIRADSPSCEPIPALETNTRTDSPSSSSPETATTKAFDGGGYHGYTAAEMDEADRNFRAGLGWFVHSRIIKSASRQTPSRRDDKAYDSELPPGMTWARSWLDAPRVDEEEIPVSDQRSDRMFDRTDGIAGGQPAEGISTSGRNSSESLRNGQHRYGCTELDALALPADAWRSVLYRS